MPHTTPLKHTQSSEETTQANRYNQNQRRIRNRACFYIPNLNSWQHCFLWRMTVTLCTPLHVPLSSLTCSPCSYTVLLHNPLSALENTFSFGVPSNSYATPEYPSIINASLAHTKDLMWFTEVSMCHTEVLTQNCHHREVFTNESNGNLINSIFTLRSYMTTWEINNSFFQEIVQFHLLGML